MIQKERNESFCDDEVAGSRRDLGGWWMVGCQQEPFPEGSRRLLGSDGLTERGRNKLLNIFGVFIFVCKQCRCIYLQVF